MRYDGHEESCDCAVCDGIRLREELLAISSARAPVRTLRVVPKSEETNRQVVEHLSDWLAKARAGEVVEIVVVAKMSDGMYETSCTGCANLHELVGILMRQVQVTLQRMTA